MGAERAGSDIAAKARALFHSYQRHARRTDAGHQIAAALPHPSDTARPPRSPCSGSVLGRRRRQQNASPIPAAGGRSAHTTMIPAVRPHGLPRRPEGHKAQHTLHPWQLIARRLTAIVGGRPSRAKYRWVARLGLTWVCPLPIWLSHHSFREMMRRRAVHRTNRGLTGFLTLIAVASPWKRTAFWRLFVRRGVADPRFDQANKPFEGE